MIEANPNTNMLKQLEKIKEDKEQGEVVGLPSRKPTCSERGINLWLRRKFCGMNFKQLYEYSEDNPDDPSLNEYIGAVMEPKRRTLFLAYCERIKPLREIIPFKPDMKYD